MEHVSIAELLKHWGYNSTIIFVLVPFISFLGPDSQALLFPCEETSIDNPRESLHCSRGYASKPVVLKVGVTTPLGGH